MIKMIQDPKMREMVRKMIKTEMIKNYQKVVETSDLSVPPPDTIFEIDRFSPLSFAHNAVNGIQFPG